MDIWQSLKEVVKYNKDEHIDIDSLDVSNAVKSSLDIKESHEVTFIIRNNSFIVEMLNKTSGEFSREDCNGIRRLVDLKDMYDCFSHVHGKVESSKDLDAKLEAINQLRKKNRM